MKHRLPIVSLCLLGTALLTSCGNDHKHAVKSTSNPDSLENKQAYVNPVDSMTYGSDGEWKRYEPETAAPQPAGANSMKKVILLTNQHVLRGLISIDLLVKEIQYNERLTLKEMEGTKEKGEILMQHTIYANKGPKVLISIKGDLDPVKISQIKEKLEKDEEHIRTSKDSCSYQLHYLINKSR